MQQVERTPLKEDDSCGCYRALTGAIVQVEGVCVPGGAAERCGGLQRAQDLAL